MRKSKLRAALAASLGATLALALGGTLFVLRSAQAQGENKTTAETKTATDKSAGAGVTVFIDPATGKIRQPDAAEIGDLQKAARQGRKEGAIGKEYAPFPLKGGGIGLMVDPSMDASMVVTKTPDGKMKMDCVTGATTAEAIVHGEKVTPAKKTLDEK